MFMYLKNVSRHKSLLLKQEGDSFLTLLNIKGKTRDKITFP